jgi:hypothetical protein
MTLQIEEVIFSDMLVNFYGATWCQSQMKYSQVSKSESLLCSSMSSACLRPLHTHVGLKDDVAFLTELVNARNKCIGKACNGRQYLRGADLDITKTRRAMYSGFHPFIGHKGP